MKIGKVTMFAFKNAFRRKIVAVLAIAGISVAITMQVTINAFTTGMDETFNDIFGELVGTFQLQEKDSPFSYASQLPANITETIIAIIKIIARPLPLLKNKNKNPRMANRIKYTNNILRKYILSLIL